MAILKRKHIVKMVFDNKEERESFADTYKELGYEVIEWSCAYSIDLQQTTYMFTLELDV